MKRSMTLMAMALPILLNGCQSDPNGQPSIPGVTSGHKWDDDYAKLLEQQYSNLPQYIAANYTGLTIPAQRVIIRNGILKDLVWLDDYYYRKSCRNFYGSSNNISFIGDVVILGLTSAATITGGSEAKTVLSGIAALTSGVEANYSSDYLHQQTVDAIINQMNTLRSQQYSVILNGMSTDDSDYSLQDGLSDVQKYITAGTVSNAIIQMGQVAAASATAANANVQLQLKHQR